ncbi:pentatricopeptide repeat-containing protein At3g04750, mitochondrial-like, partial [Carica papaya]|uniref:pentatricopeptide repeat-containing protein At3g04750, mitochondrial-like n=1 Tax=Carica papaya TaxID=3649 RepID=UPI000B8D0484
MLIHGLVPSKLKFLSSVCGESMCSRYGRQGFRFLTSTSTRTNSNWDPTLSLQLNHPTLVLLEKCSSRVHFKQILAQIMRVNLIAATFPMSRLILFSAISYPQNLDLAVLLFNHFTPNPNLYIYNTMISALWYSSSQSLALYSSMLRSCVYPDKNTLVYLVKSSKCLVEVKQIHCHAVVTGLLLSLENNYLQNSLMKMYIENGQMGLAHMVFLNMPEPDTASYNVMIVGYAKKGCSLEAVKLFHQMVALGLEYDEFTILGLLVCCGKLGELRLGKSVHGLMEK